MGRTIVLTAALVVAALLSWLELDPPRAKPLGAPAAQFSAERAMSDVRAISREPRPMGSPAARAARDHLMARLGALGLSPEVQTAEAWERRPAAEPVIVGGQVENVVAVLPGRRPEAPAVLVMAHYDTVPGSPGAADDAAGVAAMLEIARALKAAGPLERDVVFLFTDGEEVGLLGARAFFAEHPLARRIGFTINLEARGGSGRALMFQTAPDNGETIQLFARSAVRPMADSLSQYVYERMPNDTDFTVAVQAGTPGLNFAFIGRQFDYHAPTATPANLDRGSLQDLGTQALAAVREAASAETLPRASPSRTFATLFGSLVVSYPPMVGWLVIAIAALLLLAGAARARKLGAPATWMDVAQGAGASLYLLLFAAALLRLARRATGAPFGFIEQKELLARAALFEAALVIVGLAAALYAAAALARGKGRIETAVLAATAGLAASLFGGVDLLGIGLGGAAALIALAVFGRPASLPGAWAGVLTLALLVAGVTQILAPTAAFILAWPLTLAAGGAALVAMAGVKSFVDTLMAAVVAALGLAWLGPYVHLAYQALDTPELLAAFAWIAAWFIWPLAHPRIGGGGRLTALALLIAGAGLIAWIRFSDPWSERYPQPVGVAYVVDGEAQQAWRVGFLGADTPYVRAVLTADGGAVTRGPLPPIFPAPVASAPAPLAPASAPVANLTEGLEGARLLTVLPPAGARSLGIEIRPNVELADLALDGRPTGLTAPAGEWTRLRWVGDPAGLTLSFRTAGPGQLETRFWSLSDAWPADAAPPPAAPRRTMAYGNSGATFSLGAAAFSW